MIQCATESNVILSTTFCGSKHLPRLPPARRAGRPAPLGPRAAAATRGFCFRPTGSRCGPNRMMRMRAPVRGPLELGRLLPSPVWWCDLLGLFPLGWLIPVAGGWSSSFVYPWALARLGEKPHALHSLAGRPDPSESRSARGAGSSGGQDFPPSNRGTSALGTPAPWCGCVVRRRSSRGRPAHQISGADQCRGILAGDSPAAPTRAPIPGWAGGCVRISNLELFVGASVYPQVGTDDLTSEMLHAAVFSSPYLEF